MFNIDLKSLGGMESHRGIGYLMMVTAIFAPSFISLSFLRPELVESHLLLGVLLASSVGLLSTAGIIAAIFMAVANPAGTAEQMKRVGARALGVGPALSLVAQAAVLSAQLGIPRAVTSYGTYVGSVGLLVLAFAAVFLALGHRRAIRNASEGKLADSSGESSPSQQGD